MLGTFHGSVLFSHYHFQLDIIIIFIYQINWHMERWEISLTQTDPEILCILNFYKYKQSQVLKEVKCESYRTPKICYDFSMW